MVTGDFWQNLHFGVTNVHTVLIMKIPLVYNGLTCDRKSVIRRVVQNTAPRSIYKFFGLTIKLLHFPAVVSRQKLTTSGSCLRLGVLELTLGDTAEAFVALPERHALEADEVPLARAHHGSKVLVPQFGSLILDKRPKLPLSGREGSDLRVIDPAVDLWHPLSHLYADPIMVPPFFGKIDCFGHRDSFRRCHLLILFG